MKQKQRTFSEIETIVSEKNVLLVCDNVFDLLNLAFPFPYVRFSEFSINPLYEEVLQGVERFRQANSDFILAIGGGSSLDVAKGIKFVLKKDIPILAVPTTAGTGSEATHFAVVYKNGEKHSLAKQYLLPDFVVLEPCFLNTLPIYQRKCTLLDALCQAIESLWAKRRTFESAGYARKAIELIIENMDAYLSGSNESNAAIMQAAHLSGKAINLTTTTAPHAMSYKLTALYGLPHGHAVALCLPKVWAYMGGFDEIAEVLGQKNHVVAIVWFENLLRKIGLVAPSNVSTKDLNRLVDSVNEQRLENNPVLLTKEEVRRIYQKILL